MLQVARLAPRLLGESIANVRSFLSSQQSGGGFVGRDGNPDLYYTVFGLDGLTATDHAGAANGAPVVESPSASSAVDRAAVASFLANFGRGDDLDLVHLACLARAWSAISDDGIAIGVAGAEGTGAPIDGLLGHLL